VALKSMSIDRLMSLREKVDAALRAKVAKARNDLEAKLSNLSRLGSSGARGRVLRTRFGTVAPKYRNPENSSETWAGRGLKPRWLASALKAGHKIEEFLIGGAPKPATKASKGLRGRKTAVRKSTKQRKAVARKTKSARVPRKAAATQPTTRPEASS
jgi:DNA-binding protein H-NS